MGSAVSRREVRAKICKWIWCHDVFALCLRLPHQPYVVPAGGGLGLWVERGPSEGRSRCRGTRFCTRTETAPTGKRGRDGIRETDANTTSESRVESVSQGSCQRPTFPCAGTRNPTYRGVTGPSRHAPRGGAARSPLEGGGRT